MRKPKKFSIPKKLQQMVTVAQSILEAMEDPPVIEWMKQNSRLREMQAMLQLMETEISTGQAAGNLRKCINKLNVAATVGIGSTMIGKQPTPLLYVYIHRRTPGDKQLPEKVDSFHVVIRHVGTVRPA